MTIFFYLFNKAIPGRNDVLFIEQYPFYLEIDLFNNAPAKGEVIYRSILMDND